MNAHRFIAAGFLACIAVGCGDAPVSRSDVAHVHGKLLLRGRPYTKGTMVVFSDPAIGQSFDAWVDSAGEFRTSEPAPFGSYRVYLATPPNPEAWDPQPQVRDPNVPGKYYDEVQTTLTAKVPGSEDGVVLDMK